MAVITGINRPTVVEPERSARAIPMYKCIYTCHFDDEGKTESGMETIMLNVNRKPAGFM